MFMGITLEKAFLSSPDACKETAEERLKTLGDCTKSQSVEERKGLWALLEALQAIQSKQFTKYQGLLTLIKEKRDGLNWNAKKTDDRLVIFTERIATLNWLRENLQSDLKLKSEQVAVLHGQLTDLEMQQIVDDFGNRSQKLRLLICSDVASEGINLHYLCYRLIHFDLPWSIMRFQQRNGRIDRYGQEQIPTIIYLISQTENAFITRDIRILKRLREKYEQAVENIGDPANLLGLHSIEKEEVLTQDIIFKELDPEQIDKEEEKVSNKGEIFANLFLGLSETTAALPAESVPTFSLFPNSLAYCSEGLAHLREKTAKLDFESNAENDLIQIKASTDLVFRFSYFPKEIQIDPKNPSIFCTANREAMNQAIEQSRAGEESWPDCQYLWHLNPVILWLSDRMMTTFERHHAPVLTQVPGIQPDQVIFLISGLVFNERNHPLLHQLIGVVFSLKDQSHQILSMEEFTHLTGLDHSSVPNSGVSINLQPLKDLRSEAIDLGIVHF